MCSDFLEEANRFRAALSPGARSRRSFKSNEQAVHRPVRANWTDGQHLVRLISRHVAPMLGWIGQLTLRMVLEKRGVASLREARAKRIALLRRVSVLDSSTRAAPHSPGSKCLVGH